MSALYFAYGSNMRRARLFERVPGAESLGAARLPGFDLCMNKRGADGSAKANLVVETSAEVWGVLYRVGTDGLATLDRHEGGYERLEVAVVDVAGARIAAVSYHSGRLIDDPTAFDWYLRHMLEGAREHALPREWILRLETLPTRPDPRRP